MVVVGVPVAPVRGHVELVGAADQLETIDDEGHFAVAGDANPTQFLDFGVGAVAAHAVGVENADAKDEVVQGKRRADAHRHRQPIALS